MNVRHVAPQDRDGIHQVVIGLVRDERADRSDDGRPVRQPELRVHVGTRRGVHVREVEPVVHDDGATVLDAGRDQGAPHRLRRAHEPVHLPVLPARERVLLDRRIAAPRGDEGRLRPLCVERQRQGRHRDRVRVVGVDHLGRQPAHDAREAPAGGEVGLRVRREGQRLQPFARVPAERRVGVRDELRPVPGRTEAEHGQEYLALLAPPVP